MNKIRKFYDLDAWRQAHRLVLSIYELSKEFPEDERFGLTVQMRRAASSIAANIAEGFARYHYKDKVKFYYQARGSVAELQNFLILAKDLNYIQYETCKEFGEAANRVYELINGLIRSAARQV